MWFVKHIPTTVLMICGLSYSYSTKAQFTFSKMDFGVMNTVYNSVQVLTDGYLTCGWTFDTIPSIHKDILLTKFSLDGQNLQEWNYGQENFEFFTQEDSQSFLEDIFIQQAVSQNEQGTMAARLIWYNSTGDTIQTREYLLPYLTENNGNDFINPLYTILLTDSTIYMSLVIFDDDGTANDVCIWHLNKNGNELWHYIYATEADLEQCYTMIPWGGGVLAEINKGYDSNPFLNELVLIILNGGGQLEEELPESL
jgi:hypothetical protein